MTLTEARGYATQSRSNIGRLLQICYACKVQGDRIPRHVVEDIQKSRADLKRLYVLFPELKPVRVRQLSLAF